MAETVGPEQKTAVQILQDLEDQIDQLVTDTGKEISDYFVKRFGAQGERIYEPSEPSAEPGSPSGAVRSFRDIKPTSWKDAEEAEKGEKADKKKTLPKWKGIRGLLKWLWKGDEDKEPYSPVIEKPQRVQPLKMADVLPPLKQAEPLTPQRRMAPKWQDRPFRWKECHMTLREYVEFDAQIDVLADEIIDTLFAEQSVYDDVTAILDRFRNRLKELVHNARVAVERGGYAPAPTPEEPLPKAQELGPGAVIPKGGKLSPAQEKGKKPKTYGSSRAEPDPTPASVIAQDLAQGPPPKEEPVEVPPTAEELPKAEPTVKPEPEAKQKIAKRSLKEKLDDPGDEPVIPPQLTWFPVKELMTNPERIKNDPSLGTKLKKVAGQERHVDVLRWLIKNKINILDRQAVRDALEKATGLAKQEPQKGGALHLSGDIVGQLLRRIGVKSFKEQPDQLEYITQKLLEMGWKPKGNDLVRLRNVFEPWQAQSTSAGKIEPTAPVEPKATPKPEPEAAPPEAAAPEAPPEVAPPEVAAPDVPPEEPKESPGREPLFKERPPKPAEISPAEEKKLRSKGKRLKKLYGDQVNELLKATDKLPPSEERQNLEDQLEIFKREIEGMAGYEPGFVKSLQAYSLKNAEATLRKMREQLAKLQPKKGRKRKPKKKETEPIPLVTEKPGDLVDGISKMVDSQVKRGDISGAEAAMVKRMSKELQSAVQKAEIPDWVKEGQSPLEHLKVMHDRLAAEEKEAGAKAEKPKKSKPKPKPEPKPEPEPEPEPKPEAEGKIQLSPKQREQLTGIANEIEGLPESPVKDEFEEMIQDLGTQAQGMSPEEIDDAFDMIQDALERTRGEETFVRKESVTMLDLLPIKHHKTYYLWLLRH